MEAKPKSQKKIDKKAVRELKAVGADDEGGQDWIVPGQRVSRFKGIEMRGNYK